MDFDKNIQMKINTGIEAAIKIVMKKTIKYIDDRVYTLDKDTGFKIEILDAKMIRKNIELQKVISNVKNYSDKIFQLKN